jgi:Glycosyltransferases involved in cell wall biogenesis
MHPSEFSFRPSSALPAHTPADAAIGIVPAVVPFDPVLVSVLGALRGKRVIALFNRGNRGDGVIHMGGRRLFGALGLEWTEIREAEAPRKVHGDALLVFGCGAFCHGTHTLVDVVERYASQVGEVVILPASFDLTCGRVRRFLRTWDERFVVFCRERRSFAAVTAARPRARQVLLSHDLAFWADLREWAQRTHAGVGAVFRRDAEAVFDRRPRIAEALDVSRGPDTQPEALLDFVARHAVIHTDRTHAAITGAMMGREVWFYRNAYFKNEAIHEHSLAHLPHVRFVGKQPFSLRQCGRTLYAHHVQRNIWRARAKLATLRRRRSAAAGANGYCGIRIAETPALSVIMPAYNAERYVAAAIESVLRQTWRDFEFIIVDDGSTDGTRALIEQHAARDARIRSCPNERNLGVVKSLNRALSLARAEWIARMDADDISLPTRFERQMAAAKADADVGLVTCPFDVIDADERRRPGWRGICFQQELLPFFLLFYNRLNAHGQVMYPAKLVRELGGYREDYHLSEATDLWIRMIRVAKCRVVPEPLYLWRAANPNSVTKQNPFRYAEWSLRACQDEIRRTCGLEVTREQMVALRDFWLRYDDGATDWDEVERLVRAIAERYRPPREVAGWKRKVAAAVGAAWLSHATLELKRRNLRAAAGRLVAAARAARGWLPWALAQFGAETIAVRGQVSRRA